METALLDDLVNLLDLLPEEGLFADHELEAVVVGGVVGSCDHDPSAGLLGVDSVVEDRSGDHAEVDDLQTCGEKAGDEGVPEGGGGEAGVSSHEGACFAALSEQRTEGFSYGLDALRSQVFVNDSSDVVAAENMWVDSHGPSWLTSKNYNRRGRGEATSRDSPRRSPFLKGVPGAGKLFRV